MLKEKFVVKQQEGFTEEGKPGGGMRQYSKLLMKRKKHIRSGKKSGEEEDREA